MKYLSSRFEEYLAENENCDLHENMNAVFENIKENTKNHLIFYGPPGVGKYTQMLKYIHKYSPSTLKYERKINFNISVKKDYSFKISDIHFEIDMELLGCNAKVLFNEVYNRVLDIFSTRQNTNCFIICKNFHCIHSELLDIFYSYMQNLSYKNIKLTYILISEHIGFIPDNILNKCQIINFKRPTKKQYKKCTNVQIPSDVLLEDITNIKNIINDISILNNIEKKICDKIIHEIENYKNINFLEFRDLIYDIFIYNLDLNQCLYYILEYFIKNNKLNNDNISNVLFKSYKFFRFYNNNYRPIYHLEKFLYYLCKVVHEF
mgnify:CR=1 FL=1|tara:strand:+ start:287 stop:1246 length:960 start_codon:yes stop_codon:yes gene_type:complete